MSNALPPRFMIVERRPDRRGWRWLLLSLAWVASVALAWLWASERAAPRLGEVSVELAETRERLGRQQAELRELRQRNATLVRSDQISRAANLEVQRELAQRELEIGELREDVAFYDRLGGANAKPRGLTVHSAKFVPESGGTWRYVVMLTQNLNRGAISSGRLQLSIEASATASWRRSAGTTCTSAARCRRRTTHSAISSSWRAASCCRPTSLRSASACRCGARARRWTRRWPGPAHPQPGTPEMFKSKTTPAAGQVDTLIGPQVVIRGDFHFSGGLYIEGRIIGKVIADDGAGAMLTLAENGSIEGEIRAPLVVINGRLDGDIHAGERVELAPKARVHGNVHYQVVEMHAGAQLTGRLIHADSVHADSAAHGAGGPRACRRRPP